MRPLVWAVPLALASAGLALAEPPRIETWVGHQITLGHRDLPVFGAVETRTETWVVAEVRRTEGRIVLVERPCRVRVAEAAGARISMPDAAVRALPATHVEYTPFPADGTWRAGPWPAGWDATDHDRDGHPGLTIAVDAPLCGGDLYVASRALTIARATPWGRALRGELKVKLAQTILGAAGACLSVVSSDSDERLTGRIAYAAVPDGSTCASLEREGWLDRHLADERTAP